MSNNLLPKKTGIALSMAVAGLMSVCSSQVVTAAEDNLVGQLRCFGVNKCAGYNNCGAEGNSCRGHGSCKGEGFVLLTKKSCENVGGNITSFVKINVAKSALKHCYGVNSCKGHNDCSGANNSCAGKASCKGQGFVAATEHSCDDMGGKIGA